MSEPHYVDDRVTLYHARSEELLRELPTASVDAVVTDPPYELGFMGKGWDASGIAYSVPLWAEVLRVLKPGGHLLSFGGTRTAHRMACAVEDAGFEIRDSLAWLYGSGFPKSLDVSKAIDKAAGAVRSKVRLPSAASAYSSNAGNERPWMVEAAAAGYREVDDATPATDAARQWEGWGTALKPAHEPIVVARKPLIGTVAQNVLAHGTGALNVDACRIGTDEDTRRNAVGGDNGLGGSSTFRIRERRAEDQAERSGRWPANVVLDEDMAAVLDRQSGTIAGAHRQQRLTPSKGTVFGVGGGSDLSESDVGYGDTGGASRFFYVAKAPTAERPRVDGEAHPTVKPLDLMRWLVRLVTPPGGTVLEPFAGSGTTAEACVIEGFDCIAIEQNADYLPLIMARLAKPIALDLFGGMA